MNIIIKNSMKTVVFRKNITGEETEKEEEAIIKKLKKFENKKIKTAVIVFKKDLTFKQANTGNVELADITKEIIISLGK